MPREFSYYDLLGIAPDADEGRVRTAYIALVKHIHPDRFSDREAKSHVERITVMINEAYTCLKDTDSRKQYDVWRARNTGTTSTTPEPRPGPKRQAQQPPPPPQQQPAGSLSPIRFTFDVTLDNGDVGMKFDTELTLQSGIGRSMYFGVQFFYASTGTYLKDFDGVDVADDGLVLIGFTFVPTTELTNIWVGASYAQMHLNKGQHELRAMAKVWVRDGARWAPFATRPSERFTITQY